MSKLARALILGATVAAMNLASMTAIAQRPTTRTPQPQQLAENWNYYQQATRVPPAELKTRMQADATQRALSERWTHYDHATRMSPAELQAWMQAKGRGDTSTATPTQVPAPVQPTEPSGQPAWLVGLAWRAGGGAGARRRTRPDGRQACQPQSPVEQTA